MSDELIPGLLGEAMPMSPKEADAWGSVDALVIHPVRDAGSWAGVGWKGCKKIKSGIIKVNQDQKAHTGIGRYSRIDNFTYSMSSHGMKTWALGNSTHQRVGDRG